jgi:hypothetical protein
VRLVHLFESNGQSVLETRELQLEEQPWGAAVNLPHVRSVQLRRLNPGLELGVHNAPFRNLIAQLAGSGTISCGGQSVLLSSDDLLFAEDLTGSGHTSAEVSGPRWQLVVVFDDDFDIESITE